MTPNNHTYDYWHHFLTCNIDATPGFIPLNLEPPALVIDCPTAPPPSYVGCASRPFHVRRNNNEVHVVYVSCIKTRYVQVQGTSNGYLLAVAPYARLYLLFGCCLFSPYNSTNASTRTSFSFWSSELES